MLAQQQTGHKKGKRWPEEKQSGSGTLASFINLDVNDKVVFFFLTCSFLTSGVASLRHFML